MDDWKYVDRKIVTDPKGRKWTVALMDVLGQKGDPEMPSDLLELQYASGRYFTLIYARRRRAAAGTRLPVAAASDNRIRALLLAVVRRTRRSVAAGVPGGPGRRVGIGEHPGR